MTNTSNFCDFVHSKAQHPIFQEQEFPWIPEFGFPQKPQFLW